MHRMNSHHIPVRPPRLHSLGLHHTRNWGQCSGGPDTGTDQGGMCQENLEKVTPQEKFIAQK